MQELHYLSSRIQVSGMLTPQNGTIKMSVCMRKNAWFVSVLWMHHCDTMQFAKGTQCCKIKTIQKYPGKLKCRETLKRAPTSNIGYWITFQLYSDLTLSLSISWQTSLYTAASRSSFGSRPSRNSEKSIKQTKKKHEHVIYVATVALFIRIFEVSTSYHSSSNKSVVSHQHHFTCGMSDWMLTNSRRHVLHLMSVF